MFIKKRGGFTLLELMIAIFILVVMSLLIWQISSDSIRSRRRQGEYSKIYQSARVTFRKLTDDLSMAFLMGPSFTSTGPDGAPIVETAFIGEDDGSKDSVFFNTFSHWRLMQDVHESDQAEVSYFVEADENNPDNLKLMRRETPFLDKEVKEGGVAIPLAEGVKSFNIEYYQQSANEWVPSWSSKDPRTPGKLPRAAKISLIYKDPRDPEKDIEFKTAVILELSDAPIEF